ncbi:MAG: VWA domain-containing protein [Planctomycetota bacterium]
MRRTLACLVLAVSAAAEEPGALYREYVSLLGQDFKDASNRREKIIWALRKVPDDEKRAYLLKMAARAKRPCEYIMVINGLGRIRDTGEAETLAKRARKLGEPSFLRALGEVYAKTPPPPVKEWIRTKGLRDADPIVAGACCRAAARLRMTDALDELRRIFKATATNRKKRRLAYESTRALRLLAPLEETDAFVRHVSWWVRMGAGEIMASAITPDEAGVAGVKVLLKDKEWRVRKALLEVAIWRKNKPFLLPIIEALQSDPHPGCKATAYRALKAISDRDFDYDAAAWREWAKDQAQPKTDKHKRYTFARYYGSAIVSSNVCFIVDVSKSMNKPSRHARIHVARKELRKAIAALPETTRFNMIAFSNGAERWKPKGLKPSPRTLKDAEKWIERNLRPNGQTHTWAALESAFESDPALDTIFLLSDGSPSIGEYENQSDLVQAIYAYNWERRITINTIALSMADYYKNPKDNQWGEEMMQLIARSNAGECRIVKRPPR